MLYIRYLCYMPPCPRRIEAVHLLDLGINVFRISELAEQFFLPILCADCRIIVLIAVIFVCKASEKMI